MSKSEYKHILVITDLSKNMGIWMGDGGSVFTY